MKPATVVLTVILLLGCASISFGQERRDGNWWIQQSPIGKTWYMVGFFDGMYLGNNFSYWDFVHDDSQQQCGAKVLKSFNNHMERYLKDVTNDQVSDGLDQFYADYKNRRIQVNDAVWLVVNSIAGTPQKQMDDMIESWRRNASK